MRQRTPRRWDKANLKLLVVAGFLILFAVGATKALYEVASEKDAREGGTAPAVSPFPSRANPIETFNWVAGIELTPGTFFENDKKECWGYELAPDDSIQLLDQAGTVVSETTVLRGNVKGGTCRMPFMFTGVPQLVGNPAEQVYTLLTPTGSVKLTEEEMHLTGLVRVS